MAQTGLNFVKHGYKVIGVPSFEIEEIWGIILPFVEKGLESARDTFWPSDVFKYLSNQDMQLWMLVDKNNDVKGIIITEIIVYPRRKMVNIFLLAGDDTKSWKDVWFYIEEWSKTIGCDGATSSARPGMSRFAKDEGFITYAHVVGKDYSEPTLQ